MMCCARVTRAATLSLYDRWGGEILAKIAVESTETSPAARWVTHGDGWTVSDLVCTSGPQDRPFEEQHSVTSVAVVLSGTFEYRSSTGGDLLVPGSLLLGNAGDCFTCAHEHGTGDHCLSFSYSPEFFAAIASDGAVPRTRFHTPRLPPTPAISALVARAAASLNSLERRELEALAIQTVATAVRLGIGDSPRRVRVEASSMSRVTRVIRLIENEPSGSYDVRGLADVARLSVYHFLRVFLAVTGVTPHQYLLRVRLRRAAVALKTEQTRILDVAVACGFGDISNFNRAFRAEFGVTPRTYRSIG